MKYLLAFAYCMLQCARLIVQLVKQPVELIEIFIDKLIEGMAK